FRNFARWGARRQLGLAACLRRVAVVAAARRIAGAAMNRDKHRGVIAITGLARTAVLRSDASAQPEGEARAASFCAEQFPGLAMDEMRQRAGRTVDRLVDCLGLVGGNGANLVQPVLHVHAGSGAFEDDMAAHAAYVAGGELPGN